MQHSDQILALDGLICLISIVLSMVGTFIVGYAGYRNEHSRKMIETRSSLRVDSSTLSIELHDLNIKPDSSHSENNSELPFHIGILVAVGAGVFSGKF